MKESARYPFKVSLQKEVITTLLYFDMFQHPLTKEELFYFNQSTTNLNEIRLVLQQLKQEGLVFETSGFFGLSQDPEHTALRIEANKRAEKKMKTAQRYGRLISIFPFVKAICLSGSISKGVMYEDSDIDYFIITKKGRLWLTKLLMTAFKKSVLLNSHKHFCINYLWNLIKSC